MRIDPKSRASLVPALESPGGFGAAKKKKKSRREPLPVRTLRIARSGDGSARRRGSCPSPSRSRSRCDVGATLRIEHRLYTLSRIHFVQRLEAVEWWTAAPVARDYLRLWLTGTEGGLDVLVYVDRESGQRFLQAVGD